MVTFGIEGVRYFDAFRAAGGKGGDLTYVFNICNGFYDELTSAGHSCAFYWANTDCWETDLRSTTAGGGGDDDNWGDNVDLFFINTHGNNKNGNALLFYNVKHNKWRTNSSTWFLGNNNVEWMLAYSCKTVDLNNIVAPWWPVFQRLHEFCGAYDNMWDGWTTEECGEDVGDNLTDGYAVSDSWIDGVSDWSVDNHPIVVAMERKETYGALDNIFLWVQTTNALDHLHGHGYTVPDIFPSEKYWMSALYAEG